MKNKGLLLILIIALAGCQNAKIPENKETEKKVLENNGSANLPVKVKVIKPEIFTHFITVSGTVEAEKDALISPETNGKVDKILVTEGTFAGKGQLLILLDTRVLESNINEVKVSLKLANDTYKKQKELWNQKIGSEMQYLQAKNQKETLEGRLKTLKAQLDMAHIRAPFSGIVDEIDIKTGELASPGKPVLHLVNLSRLKIYADVSEAYLSSIHEGEKVELSFPAFPNYKREATIYRTGKIINNKSRTFRIEIKLDNPDQKILPNLISRIKIADYQNNSAFVVPTSVIKQDFNGWFLYKTKNNGTGKVATKVYVKPGISSENNTEILKGLLKGEEVIVEGFNQVAEGREIKEVS